MAKNRFSRFKPNNYVVGYSNPTPKMNWNVIPNREKLNDTQRKWIVNFIQQIKLSDWEVSFMRSILAEGKKPTQKQKDTLRQIVIKYNE